MSAAEEASFEIFDESAAGSADFASIFEGWKSFRDGIQGWHGLAETSFLSYVGGA